MPPYSNPLQTCLAKLNVTIRQKGVAFTDRRTRLLNEVLNCIKLIKMYAWEESFQANITGELSNSIFSAVLF